jgi:hypothetical protein
MAALPDLTVTVSPKASVVAGARKVAVLKVLFVIASKVIVWVGIIVEYLRITTPDPPAYPGEKVAPPLPPPVFATPGSPQPPPDLLGATATPEHPDAAPPILTPPVVRAQLEPPPPMHLPMR